MFALNGRLYQACLTADCFKHYSVFFGLYQSNTVSVESGFGNLTVRCTRMNNVFKKRVDLHCSISTSGRGVVLKQGVVLKKGVVLKQGSVCAEARSLSSSRDVT